MAREVYGTVVLAGTARIARQIRRGKRRDLYHLMRRPHLWKLDTKALEARVASRINRDDYIVGENKSLLYLHPSLTSARNINFLKRVLYFAGKTGDRLYRRNKHDLLMFLSREGRSPISLVIQNLLLSDHIDPDHLVVVGPRRQLNNELERCGLAGIRVLEQGKTIGRNIIKGREALIDGSYDGEHILFIGGDVPLVTPKGISEFIRRSDVNGFEGDIIWGMGSREQLGEYIVEHDVEHLGSVGPNYPRKGNLNKFGIPLIDDRGIFGKSGKRRELMMGNLFLYRTSSVNRKLVDRFYSLRKMGASPLAYPWLLWHFGAPLLRAVRWKLTVSDAERAFSQNAGIDLRVGYAPPEITLDLDSYSDLRRLSGVYFSREGMDINLEMSFREFIRQKRRERGGPLRIRRKKVKGEG